MPDLMSSLSLLSLVISLGTALGGFVAFFLAVRTGFFRQSSEIQTQTITALQARVGTLESQAEMDAKEIKRLRTVINTVRYALKRKGMLIEIDGEYVTLIENGQSDSTPLQPEPPHKASGNKVRPLKTKIGSEEEDEAAN